MAYVDQSKKVKISAALKAVMPQGWKYSLAVRNHSTIVLTIAAAPFDLLLAMSCNEGAATPRWGYESVNHHHVRECFADECVADVFERIVGALNTDNHDNSDITTDYFDVGHYVDIKIGRFDKPFVVLVAPALAI